MKRDGCPSPEVLSAFVLGDLDESELDGLLEHLDSCETCAAGVASLDGQADTLLLDLRRRLRGSSGTVTRPAAGPHLPDASPGPPDRLDDFQIVREIGRGGMGVVYEAYQGSLNRHVAVKLLREPADLSRFRREARAAGRLHHTNIVPVHGVGEYKGRHYYVMQYIAGRGLDAFLRAKRDAGAAVALGFREIARIVLQAAEAVAYAHDQGIVHRDVKPSNILLDERGTVWVTDFGLAYDSSDTRTLTHTGDLVGTLRYMAPERFAGRGDARVDVYALGATLYELTCGRPAFADSDQAALIHRVLHHDPPRPRQVDPRVPRDLETIIFKAMAREPARRYATAAELAEDLRRFVEDRPIRARRVGVWERSVRWCRRNTLAAGLLAGLVLVFLSGFAGVTVQWRRADAAASLAQNEATRANAEAARAGALARAEAEARAAESTLRIRAQGEIAVRDFDRGLELARRGDSDLGMLWMAESLRQAPVEEAATARMIRANLAAWEGTALPLRAILEHNGPVMKAQFGPGGRSILTGSADGVARLWDAATGRPLGPPLVHGDIVVCIALSPDGRLALTGGRDGKARAWDPTTGRSTDMILNHGANVIDVSFAPDGRLIMTRGLDYTMRLWDAATGRPVGPAPWAENAEPTEFSPDGRLIAVGGSDDVARIWDVAAGRRFGPTLRPGFRPRFSPDGRSIATGGRDGTSMLWDVATGRSIVALPRIDGQVGGLRFSPDGRRILVISWDSAEARIVDAATGRAIGQPLRHGSGVGDGGFALDGRLVATASKDHTARLWDAATGRPVGTPLRHRRDVNIVSFSPDGQLLLTGSLDGTAKLWEIGRADITSATVEPADFKSLPASVPLQRGSEGGFGTIRFNPDRARVIMTGGRDLARLVNTRSGQPTGPPIPLRWHHVGPIAFSPDGSRVVIAGHDVTYGEGGGRAMTCQVFDADAGLPISPLLPHIEWVGAVSFRCDGAVLATGDYSGAVHLWDVPKGIRVGSPLRACSIVRSLAFSPDGRMLAVGTAEPIHQASLWDLSTNRPIGDPIRFRGTVHWLSFNRDGDRLVAGSRDGSARLVEVSTGRAVGEAIRIGGEAAGLAFSPDGQLLLTVGEGEGEAGVARVWNSRSGRAASPRMVHPAQIADSAFAFTADGRRFAAGCEDGTIHIWDVATSRPIGPPRRMREPVRAVAFGPGDRSLFAVGCYGDTRTWNLAEPWSGSVERLIGRVKSRTGLELDSAREAATIEPEEWRRVRAEAGEPESSPDRVGDADWHESCARDAEAIGDGFGSSWHLDRLIAARPADGLLYARRARAWLRSGDARSADADLDRSIKLGPREQIVNWLAHRADDAHAEGRPVDALWLIGRAIAWRPGDWRLYALRAGVYAGLGRPVEREGDLASAIDRGADIPFLVRLAAERSRAGRWSTAVALYDRAIAMGTIPFEVWGQAAIAHLKVDDDAGYRRVCKALRDRHSAVIPEVSVLANLANVLTLGPGGVGDDGKGSAWIEGLSESVHGAPKERIRGFQQLSAAVLFRAGRWDEAIRRIHGAIEIGGGLPDFEENVYLAMLSSRSRDPAQALYHLGRLADEGPDGPSSEQWWKVQARRLLRREATRLILDQGFPADFFAP